jgi:hypothetical protein
MSEMPAIRWTTYGVQAYDELLDVVSAAKADDPLSPVTLLVPTDLSGVAARRALARSTSHGRTGIAGLSVLTVARLAELIGAPTLVAHGRRPLTGSVLAAAWRAALAHDAGVFEPVADHPATVTALVGAHRQLRDLDTAQLDALIAAGPVTREVVRLHREVLASCAATWYDAAQLLDTARAQLSDANVTPLGSIVMFLPQELSVAAAALVRALAERAPVTVIAASTGDRRADHGVLRTLASAGVSTSPANVAGVNASTVMHASDSDDEVRCVVREVMHRLESTPAHRMAVLYGNPNPYARLLHEQLEAAGVTVNGPGVKAAAERTVPRAFAELLELLDTGALDRSALFRVLSSAPFRRGDGRRVPTSRWERLSRRAGVTTSDTWAPRLTLIATAARNRGEDVEEEEWQREHALREADDADELLAFVQSLESQATTAADLTAWPELSVWAVNLLKCLFGDETTRMAIPDDDRRAADTLERVLRSLTGLASVEDAASLTSLREVLALELADDITRVGRFGTGVLVAPLSTAVGLDLDVVFVVGLAEGVTPTAVSDDPLLPDDARELVAPALPAIRDRLDRQHRLFLAALSSAPERILSFPRGDLRSSGGRIPSRWLLPTLRTLSGDATLAAAEWDKHHQGDWLIGSPSYAATVTSTPEPATEQEWRQRALDAGMRSQVEADDVALARASALRAARASTAFTRFDGNLAGHTDSLPDLTDPARQHSSTSLEQWVGCPHAYFVQRLLRVRPVEEPELELSITPLERGNLMHEALDTFFHWVQGHGDVPASSMRWSHEQRAELQAIGAKVADEFEARGVTGHPTLWARDRELILKDLDLLLTEDEHVRAEGGRQQVHAELRFGGDDPVVVTLPDGRTMALAGSVDRIDRTADGLVVVDYKSGSNRKFEGISAADPDGKGTKLQLPVYGYAARQQQGTPTAPVRAEYWFIGPKDRGDHIGYDLTPEIEERYGSVLQTVVQGIAAGVFPHHPPEDHSWASWVECWYCDVDGLGADSARKRWSDKRGDPALADYVALVEPEGDDS